jgi:hypothetical protein
MPSEEILHKAFRETLDYHGKYAFVPQLIRDAERHLKGDVIAEPGMFSTPYFENPPRTIPDECIPHTKGIAEPGTFVTLRCDGPLHNVSGTSVSHTCMDYPNMECPACMASLPYLPNTSQRIA